MEFNSGKNRLTDKNLNEIIEIGAVKLDSNLIEESSFSVTVKPNLTVKLNKYVQKLTQITEDELKNAPLFSDAINSFINWCYDEDDDVVFSSWSTTDLFVLIENYSANLKKDRIDFIKMYFDLQKFATRSIKKVDNNQISLQNAAEKFNICTDKMQLHRAKDDSRICAELLRLTFDKKELCRYICKTDTDDYFRRLTYKPHYIIDINDKDIDKSAFSANCPICTRRLHAISKPTQKFSMFYTKFQCKKCKRKFILTVKFRKMYDYIDVKKRLKEIKPEQTTNNSLDNKN